MKVFPLIQIEKDGLYGLINIAEQRVIAEAVYTNSLDVARGTFKRYKCSDGRDMITDGYEFYTIPEYDKVLYSSQRYERYLNDKLLTTAEKVHNDECVKKLDEQLFSELSPEDYISTDRLSNDLKAHLKDAQETLKIRKSNKKLLEIREQTKWRYKWERTNKHTQTEVWNGNYYTHKLYTYNELQFRDNAITEETELVIDCFDNPIYIPLSKVSLNEDEYAGLESVWLPDGRYLLIYTGCCAPSKFATVVNRFTTDGLLGYGGWNESLIKMIVVDPKGKIETFGTKCVAYSPRHLNMRNGYFYTNVIVRREEVRNYRHNYKYYSNHEMEAPVENRMKTCEEESLMSLLYIYDYNLQEPLRYASKEGEIIYDVIKWRDKWVFIGSTSNKGYVGWENPYIVLLDSKLNVLSSSYYPIQGCRLRKDVSTIYDDGQSLVIPDWVKIKTDNSIEWIR